ncbi:MAG: ANTAR domain-containing protein [Oscillospiraceae bacterium]|nr:ANTAR domain-containing protein [Oscillospiraceae bacterium]
MKNAIVVSKNLSNIKALLALLADEGFEDVVTAQTSEEATEYISANQIELIVINTPLQNETGLELAIHCACTTTASIMVIVQENKSDEVVQMMTSNGILIISKPINKHLFHHYLLFSECFKKRMKSVVSENNKLKNQVETIKLVNRAKLVLMQNLRMSESQAHHYIEKQAMNLRKSKHEIALRVLKTYEN